jgi:16S rRNA (guanine966-N2)-methyltransferase
VLAAGTAAPVDLVFADPPYDLGAGEVEHMLAALAPNGWVTQGSVAVVERAAASPSVTWPPGWDRWRDRRYGDTRLEFACYGRTP